MGGFKHNATCQLHCRRVWDTSVNVDQWGRVWPELLTLQGTHTARMDRIALTEQVREFLAFR